jgi:uncharacterized protein with HEPN domain
MRPEDVVRIQHMVEAADIAAAFASGRTRADLDIDRQLAFALSRAVEIFGEAAAKISAQGRGQLPEIPWPLEIGMRNRLVHAYFDIDWDILWSSATEEIPPLLPILRAALAGDAPPR